MKTWALILLFLSIFVLPTPGAAQSADENSTCLQAARSQPLKGQLGPALDFSPLPAETSL